MDKMEVKQGQEIWEAKGATSVFDFSQIDLDESMMVSLDDYSNLELFRQSSKAEDDDDDFYIISAAAGAAANKKSKKEKKK